MLPEKLCSIPAQRDSSLQIPFLFWSCPAGFTAAMICPLAKTASQLVEFDLHSSASTINIMEPGKIYKIKQNYVFGVVLNN